MRVGWSEKCVKEKGNGKWKVYRPFSYCIDYGDLNGLGHLPEFADQISGRQILVNGPSCSDRRNQYNMRMVYSLNNAYEGDAN